ncbi:MAG TPA: 1-deoxy-D-xylulose-5-phosphate synthase [Acidobacteriota bacterium]|nr:1-deoxy-D-xylulose-5-phosphate synthase [Acidobacteriota bacterium]
MNYRYLSSIDSPEDLRKLSVEELSQVADEVRLHIINCISKTGGHLGASLGTVELCLALHYVFDTPKDKLIFDVGHQAYAHKILTGRRDRFHTIRQYGGLAPFLRREESPYDVFNAGHACTSISAALGFATARDLNRDDYRVVAVIGDAGLTGGMALEGLNLAGYDKRDLIIVLNDNEMSISPNVGALAGYLKRIVAGQAYQRIKRDIESFLHHIPAVGDRLFRTTKEIVDALKTYAIPGLLLEELGFRYCGPFNGHDVPTLVEHFKTIREMKGPILVHVLTTKGKGYAAAEKDKVKWHGPSAFDPNTATFVSGPAEIPTYTSVFAQTVVRLAQQDEKIVAITAAMAPGTGLDKFASVFPDRFFDVGIAEQHAVTFSAGLAAGGFKPVCAIYSTFLQRAYDQVIHDTCLMDLPVTFCLDRGGLAGPDGPTHHGLLDFAYLRCIPNMCVMAPKDENELQHMIKTAIEWPHPTAVRYPRGEAVGVPLDPELKCLPIGKGEILREGDDFAIIAIGSMVHPCLEAAELLARDGYSVRVVNARFVKPLDEELLGQTAKQFRFLVFAEEASEMGGFASACWEVLEKNRVYGNLFLRISLPDVLIPHGAASLLLAKYGLDVDGIYNRISQFLKDHRWRKRGSTTSLSKKGLLKVVKKP